jgi:hypothetical protein
MGDPAEQERLSLDGVSRAAATYTWEKVNAAYESSLRKLTNG